MSWNVDVLMNPKLSRWAVIAVSLVVVPLFAILIWQLASLDPVHYCQIVTDKGQPPGDNCFKLLTQGLHIKGVTIWGALATLATFVIVLLIALTKGFVSLTGPGGLGLKVGQNDDGSIKPQIGVNPNVQPPQPPQ